MLLTHCKSSSALNSTTFMCCSSILHTTASSASFSSLEFVYTQVPWKFSPALGKTCIQFSLFHDWKSWSTMINIGCTRKPWTEHKSYNPWITSNTLRLFLLDKFARDTAIFPLYLTPISGRCQEQTAGSSDSSYLCHSNSSNGLGESSFPDVLFSFLSWGFSFSFSFKNSTT